MQVFLQDMGNAANGNDKIRIVFFKSSVYNKNVIMKHKNPNKNVRRESMERFILKKLLDWKNSPYRKPLILKDFLMIC